MVSPLTRTLRYSESANIIHSLIFLSHFISMLTFCRTLCWGIDTSFSLWSIECFEEDKDSNDESGLFVIIQGNRSYCSPTWWNFRFKKGWRMTKGGVKVFPGESIGVNKNIPKTGELMPEKEDKGVKGKSGQRSDCGMMSGLGSWLHFFLT